MVRTEWLLHLSLLTRYVGVRFFSLAFTIIRAEFKMMEEFVTLVSLGFLVGMIVGMALS